MLFRIAIAAALACAVSIAAEHRGTVKSSGLPIPGATVTARQDATTRVTSTGENGEYVFSNLGGGPWKIEVEMTGFETVSKELAITDTAPQLDFDVKLQTTPIPVAPAPAQKPAEGKAGATAPVTVSGTKPAATPAAAASAPASAPTRRSGGAPSASQARRPGGPNAAAFQRLQVTQTAQNEIEAALNGPQEMASPDTAQSANESFLVTGSVSSGLQSPGAMDQAFGFGGPPSEEMRQRFEAMRNGGAGGEGGGAPGSFGGGTGGGTGGGPMMGGGRGAPGGFRGGGPGGGPGGGFGGRGGERGGGMRGRGGPMASRSFGNRNGRGRDGLHGGASFSLRNSALDAKPYSLSGQEIAKPSYAQSRFSLIGGGVLRIPKVITDDKTFFFLSYFGTRSRNPFASNATLPSPLERSGDFSESVARVPVTIYDPLTSQPFPKNVIPSSRIDPAARGLLSLIPLPNQPGLVQNYQIITSVPQNSDNFGVRLSRSVGKRDRFSGNFNMQQRNGASATLFGSRDLSSGRGMSLDTTWTHTFAPGLISNMRFTFSRNSSEGIPYFANGIDWARQLGIAGTSTDPRNYGPPNLSFTNFGGLTDGSPTLMHNQTAGIGDSLIRTKGKLTMTVGFDYRRIQLNNRSDSNGRGSYSFSGIGTSGYDAQGFPIANTGYDFADFLLGLPQSSSIRFGSSDVYFRSSSYSAYWQGDWRARSNLTINGGLRYEFLTPIHEKYGRMANLDIAPNFTGVAVVTPGVLGPYSGVFPDGLVNPDKNNLAPRIGIAWKPIPKKQTQIRAGYGWYYNGSVYNTAASRMAQQPPFAKTSSVNTSLAQPLTIETGFVGGTVGQITNTFAIDRNYRVGYAQTWSLTLQQDLPGALVMELGYLGTKGTRLDIQRLPNRAAPGSPLTSEQRRQIGNATGFTYESAEGDSIYHAGQFRLTRRFRKGISANMLYTFSKSIDNASTFGGGQAVVAQDDHDLAAERGLSSFDRRHNLSLNYIFSTSSTGGAGPQRSLLLRDWSLSGGITFRSGSPFTAVVLGNRSDAGGSGAVGSARADATGLPLYIGGGFFNPLAFTLPPATRFGNAARNTIQGPSFFATNMSFGRTIRFGETRRSMDIRAEATNLLNSVSIARIGTTVNSSSYGLALDASSMRSISLSLRFRF